MSHQEMALDALCNEAKPAGRNGGEGEAVWTAFVPRGRCTSPAIMDLAEGLMIGITSLASLRTDDQAKISPECWQTHCLLVKLPSSHFVDGRGRQLKPPPGRIPALLITANAHRSNLPSICSLPSTQAQ